MTFKKLLNEEMKDKQLLQLIYPAERPFNKTEIKILKICIYAITRNKLEDLDWVLKDQGYIKKAE